MSTAGHLSIGELAAATDVTVTTLRHYDHVGVLTPACRVGGKRRFGTDAIQHVRLIRRVQAAGFSLVEIRDLLADTSGATQRVVSEKIGELERRKAELDAAIATLELIRRCGCAEVASCPEVEALA